MDLPKGIAVDREHRAAKVAVMREADGHVLILRRSLTDERRPGEPDFPGGEVEPGETDEAAARRETLQEVGIDLAGVTLVHLCEVSRIENRNGEMVTVSQVLFRALVAQHELVVGDEHEDGDWYPLNEAAKIFEQHPTKRLAVGVIQQQLAAGELPVAC